jgi:UDP-2,3-diacylglucosamine pyrophosphatase LpxH
VNDTVFILSDLHFNATGAQRQMGILRFLTEVVRRRASRLILSGDIIDFVRGVMPPDEGPFRRLQSAVDQILAEGIPVTYLIGNHDLPLLTLLPLAEGGDPTNIYGERQPLELAPGLTLRYRTERFEYHGRRVCVEHGHIYDPGWLMTPAQEQSLYRQVSPRTDADWMSTLLGLYTTVDDYGEDGRGREERTGSLIPPLDMMRYAVRMMERSDRADWLILGHFHTPTLESLEGGRKYLNTGDSVTNGGYGALKDGQLRLGDWREMVL